MQYLLKNKKGEKITREEWQELMNDRDYRIIKQEDIKNDRWVSTVWLGSDHQFGEGEPLVFETMVFPKGDWGELDVRRYTTEEEAIKGHKEMVEKWNKINQ